MRVHCFSLLVIVAVCTGGGLMRAPAAGPPLEILVPDTLTDRWQSCISAFAAERDVDIVPLPVAPADVLPVLRDMVGQGVKLDVAVVWDGWLGELEAGGYLVHLSPGDVYWPVLLQDHVVGTRIPWAKDWCAVLLTSGDRGQDCRDLLRHSCVWMRPVVELDEYRALSESLDAQGYELLWNEHTTSQLELGGVPVEITVVPSSIKEDFFQQVIIARDQQGKTFVRREKRPASQWPGTAVVQPATLKAIHDSIAFSFDRLADPLGHSRPGYCTLPADCFDSKTLQCIQNPVACVYDWITQTLSADELAYLGLSGIRKRTMRFNRDYAWGSRLRAYKLYKAMLTQDGYNWKCYPGHTAAHIQNEITHDSGFSWIHGFDLKGTQRIEICPSGHKSWSGTGAQDFATGARLGHVLRSVQNLAGCRSAEFAWAPFLDGVMAGSEDDDKQPGLWDLIEAIPIQWELEYNAETQILTATFWAQGKACYGVYGICQVCAIGGGQAQAQAKLDGTEIHFEFKLEAYVEGECGVHPCAHGQIGGGVGVYLDITYPDACTCKVTTTFAVGWGGHGDALNIKRKSCDVYELEGPSATYNICSDTELQNVLEGMSDFTSRYGSPVTAAIIRKALNDYRLPSTAPSKPWMHGWAELDFGLSDITATLVVPQVPSWLVTGGDVAATLAVPWVEDFAGGSLLLHFDPSLLTLAGTEDGRIGLCAVHAEVEPIEPGIIRVTVAPSGGRDRITGSGSLAVLHFVCSGAGRTVLSVEEVRLERAGGGPIEARGGNASLSLVEDTDADGMDDAWERYYFGSLDCKPEDDPDGDGLSNFSEHEVGGDPTRHYAVEGGRFRRGDSNGDGAVDLADAISILNYLFAGGTTDCLDANDSNDDGTVDISDAVFLLLYLFAGGDQPPPPFANQTGDPTPDTLDCRRL